MAKVAYRTASKIFRMTPDEVGRLAGIVEVWKRQAKKGLFVDPITETKVVVTLIDREYNRLQDEAAAARLSKAAKGKRKKKGGEVAA